MKRVYFSARAADSVAKIDAWWRKHREKAPQLFSEELRSAVRLLQIAPTLGVLYEPSAERGVRRLILEETRFHIYFRSAEDGVEIIEVWSARRRHGPEL